MFEHRYPVTHADPERSAGSTFADHDRNDGCSEATHFSKIDRNGFSLTPLLGANAGIRSWRIDETDDRKTILLSQPHLHESLAIALGMRTAEVAFDLLGSGSTFVVPDDQGLHRADSTESGDDRPIVTEMSVSTKLAKIAA